MARVVGITDGDTLTVLTSSSRQIKIRLNGIDAPEKAQAFGTASRQALSALAYGKDVRVTVTDTDRYGRVVANLRTGGKDINEEQVKRGMAWWYRKYAMVPLYSHLERAQREAKSAKRGLWADAKPVPPWEWRRR